MKKIKSLGLICCFLLLIFGCSNSLARPMQRLHAGMMDIPKWLATRKQYRIQIRYESAPLSQGSALTRRPNQTQKLTHYGPAVRGRCQQTFHAILNQHIRHTFAIFGRQTDDTTDSINVLMYCILYCAAQ